MKEEEKAQLLELINDYGKEMYALGRKAYAYNVTYLDECEETKQRDRIFSYILELLK